MIKIVGLGPGHESYVLPIAIQAIKSGDLLIGARRHLDAMAKYCKNSLDYSEGFDVIKDVLINHKSTDNIIVAVSGDVGFYSMLDFVKRYVDQSDIMVIPGISSLQYFYSKLGFGYEKSTWISLHGRDFNLNDSVVKEQELGILLDGKQNNQFVANYYKDVRQNIKNSLEPIFYVGERLSYDNEKISRLTLEECSKYRAEDLSVVIVRYE